MKNNFVKILVSCIVTVAVFVGFSVNMFALPVSEKVSDNYYYDVHGVAADSPVAYRTVRMIDYRELGLPDSFEPVDLFVQGDYLYILNRAGTSVVVLDQNYEKITEIRSLVAAPGEEIPELNNKILDSEGNLVLDSEMATASKYQLNSPNGLYVNKDGDIYVADTNNRRIVVFDITGTVKNVVQAVKVTVLGSNYVFKPQKLAVDSGGGLQVIAYGVNRGIMQIDDDGTFRQFIGAPAVTIDAVEWFWRQFASAEQRQRMVTYVPTEYNNVSIDDRGFLYATISTLDGASLKAAVTAKDLSGKTTPILRLNSSGLDSLRRKGFYPPVGDLSFDEKSPTQIVDVAIADDGFYTMLDTATGRFFTYDDSGNFLYMAGGKGNQTGCFKTAAAIAVKGSQMIVSDTATKSITIFEETDYAKLIKSAVIANSSGQYEVAKQLWSEVAVYNSNSYIAYIGMGKAEMRMANVLHDESRFEHYENALTYFSLATEKENYSKAFTELQRESMSKNFGLIVGSIAALIIILFVLYFVNKYRKKKKKEGGAK